MRYFPWLEISLRNDMYEQFVFYMVEHNLFQIRDWICFGGAFMKGNTKFIIAVRDPTLAIQIKLIFG